MTPEKIKKLREALGWSVATAASKFQVSARTWTRWEASQTKMATVNQERLEKLYKFKFGSMER